MSYDQDAEERPNEAGYRAGGSWEPGRTPGVRQMTLMIRDDPVPLRIDDGGAVRVGATRVTLETVLHGYRRGASPEEIAESFDTLKLADVYSVIGYYLRHQSEVDAYLQRVEEAANLLRQRIESQPGYQERRERLLARRAALSETRE